MILPRLILGTARVAGGADEGRAADLIRSALDRGITAIDTAPSYGMGTAEAAVGTAVRGYDAVEITTKLGSSPPSSPWLRTLVRRAKRMVTQDRPSAPGFAPPSIEAPTGNRFTPAEMERSLNRSLGRLGRIDTLLLHDISLDEARPEVIEVQARLCGSIGARAGYAVYSQWDARYDTLFPAVTIAQCAPDPNWLRSEAAGARAGELRLHSIGKTGLALAASDAAFRAALNQASAIIPARDLRTAELAAIYALASVRIPTARLLITSSHKDRLEALLGALGKIDRTGGAAAIAASFGAQAG